VSGVLELSASYANFMLRPWPGPEVCAHCFDLTGGGTCCRHCSDARSFVDAMTAVSYSIGGEQLHHALAGYKRYVGTPGRYFTAGLAAVLWRHLDDHEPCLARAAGVEAFDLVTTVPSSDARRDATHPLHGLVGELIKPIRPRYARLLRRTDTCVTAHRFHAERYTATTDLRARTVLLIDDTWTTGANAQSAAAALKAAGAERVAALVIGRYVNREWGHNDRQLRRLSVPFDWNRCAVSGHSGTCGTCGNGEAGSHGSAGDAGDGR
jgi:predicted amidophosphoribosyltransferase